MIYAKKWTDNQPISTLRLMWVCLFQTQHILSTHKLQIMRRDKDNVADQIHRLQHTASLLRHHNVIIDLFLCLLLLVTTVENKRAATVNATERAFVCLTVIIVWRTPICPRRFDLCLHFKEAMSYSAARRFVFSWFSSVLLTNLLLSSS